MDWNEGLKLVSYCPVCETRYNPMEAQHLGQDGDTHILHITCRTCGNAILAMVLLNRVGASSVGLITDLSSDDVVRFARASAITIDDVIDAHAFMEKEGWKSLLQMARKPRMRAKAAKPRKT